MSSLRVFVCSRIAMNDGDYRHHPSPTTVQLNKPRHSSSVPLRRANQSYSYYERNKDLDLGSQKSVLPGHECFFGSEPSWRDPPLRKRKSR
jgi:hypothetical protein